MRRWTGRRMTAVWRLMNTSDRVTTKGPTERKSSSHLSPSILKVTPESFLFHVTIYLDICQGIKEFMTVKIPRCP
jgi:hypothetical protein